MFSVYMSLETFYFLSRTNENEDDSVQFLVNLLTLDWLNNLKRLREMKNLD